MIKITVITDQGLICRARRASVGEKGSGGRQSLSAPYGVRKGARYDRRHLWQETSLGHLPSLKLARPIFWRGGGRVG